MTCRKKSRKIVAARSIGANVSGRETIQTMMLSMTRARTRFHQPESTTPSGVVAAGCDCQPASCADGSPGACPYAGHWPPPCPSPGDPLSWGGGPYPPCDVGAPCAPCEPDVCGRAAAGVTPYGIPMWD